MSRPWIVSFVLVALVVAGILYFTQDSGEPGGPAEPKTEPTKAQSLTTNDVLKYLEVYPEVDSAMFAIAQSGNRDPQAVPTAIRPILAKHSLSMESWNQLWRRVEDVVNSIRAEQSNPERLQKINRILDSKRSALAATDGELKKRIEQDIKGLEAERDREIVKIHPTDREVVMRYWDQLNRMAPRIR